MALSFLEWCCGRKPDLFLKVLSYVIGAIFLFLAVYRTFGMQMTWKKYKLITRRSTMERWDQSYCLLSRLLVQILLIGTPFCIALLICNTLIFFIDYDNGYDLYNNVKII